MALELSILGHLSEGELHGYELRKRVAVTLRQPDLSDGSLYPALNRLERAGLVSVAGKITTRNPSQVPGSGSLAGELAAFRASIGRGRTKSRRSYRLTEVGHHAFLQMLSGDNSDDKTFFARVYFLQALPVNERERVLEDRKLILLDRIQAERLALDSTDNAEPFRRALDERAVARLEADIAWIDRLLASEEMQAPQSKPALLDNPVAIAAAPTTEDFR